MIRIAPFVLACLLGAACSSNPPTTTDGAATDDGTGAIASQPDDLATQAPDAGTPAGLPSGAKVRILNAYVPSTGDPGALDVYAAQWVLEGASPLLSVPYGTVSDYFDPTVLDEAGDMALSVYIAGQTGNGNEVASQTETLKGGEVITMVVTTGSSEKSDGGRYGAMQVFFQAAKGTDFGQATPEPGSSVLIVSTVGLEQIMANPDAQALYLRVDGDSSCTKSIGDDEYTLTGVGPGSATAFQLDPGAHTASIYSVSNSTAEFPACTGTPLLKDIAITTDADQTTLLELYGPKDGDLRTLVIPLDK